jgi:hypothetical protein
MPRKKQISEKQTNDLLVQMMNDMNAKLHQIHKDVTKNKSDIARIQNEISFGKGGVKVLIWLVGLLSAIMGYLNYK